MGIGKKKRAPRKEKIRSYGTPLLFLVAKRLFSCGKVNMQLRISAESYKVANPNSEF